MACGAPRSRRRHRRLRLLPGRTRGAHSSPVAPLAARIVLLEPNAAPGLTAVCSRRWSTRFGASATGFAAALQAKCRPTGIPVRASLRSLPSREEAAARLGLDPNACDAARDRRQPRRPHDQRGDLARLAEPAHCPWLASTCSDGRGRTRASRRRAASTTGRAVCGAPLPGRYGRRLCRCGSRSCAGRRVDARASWQRSGCRRSSFPIRTPPRPIKRRMPRRFRSGRCRRGRDRRRAGIGRASASCLRRRRSPRVSAAWRRRASGSAATIRSSGFSHGSIASRAERAKGDLPLRRRRRHRDERDRADFAGARHRRSRLRRERYAAGRTAPARGNPVTIGQAARNVAGAGVVVVSSAIERNNPEYVGRACGRNQGSSPRRDARANCSRAAAVSRSAARTEKPRPARWRTRFCEAAGSMPASSWAASTAS